MKLILQRAPFGTNGVAGVLCREDGTPLCVTMEDPWQNNQVGISCIPPGTYKVVRHDGARFRRVWRLANVPGRTAILIHAGNTKLDTSGCILVGRWFGTLRGLPAILSSVLTLNMLRQVLPWEFDLEIRNSEGD